MNVPSEEEIKLVVKSLASWNSLGPDGFPAGFYQTQYEVVGENIIKLVHDFFIHKFFPNKLNETAICLIIKVSNPCTPSDYRPIGLCNTSYEII